MRDVVIVGGRIPGLALALWLQRSGRTVTVVDRGIVAGRIDGLSPAPAATSAGLFFHHTERWHGRAAARTAASEIEAAVAAATDLAQELDVAAQPTTVAITTSDNHEAFWVRYESMAMHRAGLRPEFDDAQRLPWPVRPYLEQPGQLIDPVALRDRLLQAVLDAGGELRDEVPEAGVRVSATPWPVTDPLLIRPRLRRSTWQWAEITGLELDRVWAGIDDGGVLLIPSSDGALVGARDVDPADWVSARGPKVEVRRRWESSAAESREALPFVGSLPFTRSLGRGDFVMAGHGPWDLSLGLAAARQLHGAITGTADELPWAPQRAVRPETLGRAAWGATRLKLNLNSVTPFPKAPRYRSTHHR